MADLTDTELRAWRAFLAGYARVVPRLDEELAAAHGLRLNQYEVLLRLKLAPGDAMRMTDLAASVYLSPSGITRAVDQLERRGLVERRVCATDRRGFFATITPAGKTLLRAASKVHVAGIREHFFAHLSASQIESLGSALETIAEPEIEAAS